MDNKSKKSNKIKVLIIVLTLTLLIGVSYAFFMYSRTSSEISKVVTGDIYMHYIEKNELELFNAFPQTKEEGIQNNYFEFSITGKNTTKNKDIYYAVNLVYGDEETGMKRYHDEDIVFYLTEVIDGEEVVLIDSVQYKNINDAKIYVETIPYDTKQEIEHIYRLRMWIADDVLISDTDQNANYTTGEYYNSYTSVKVNVEGNLKENDINMILDANDDNYVNGKRAIFVDTYGNKNDNLVLEVSSDSENIGFIYEDEKGNSSSDVVDTLTLNYKSYEKEVIVTKVVPVAKNDSNTKTKLLFKLTRNGEVVEQQVKSLTVYGNNYCLNNGFTKLSDCILVSEKMSNSVSEAKTFIANKGTPDFSKTAPVMKYAQKVEEDITTNVTVTGYQFYVSQNITFNEDSGRYALASPYQTVSLDEEGTYKDYYTCGGTNLGASNCATIYKINEVTIDGNKTTLTKYTKYTSVETEVFGESDVGLYKTNDDDGETFYYRGAVTNNNVKFAGFDWKVVRINGDGSIRLIKSLGIGNSQYNTRSGDIAYAGYTYNKNFNKEEVTSAQVNYSNINVGTTYYFGKKENYMYNEETGVYNLVATDDSPLKTGMVPEMATTSNIESGYVYTCFSESIEGTCEVLKQISDVFKTATTYVPVKYISHSSTSYEDVKGNDFDSTIKTTIDSWYENSLVTYTNYLEDTTYCNDKSMPNSLNRTEFKLSEYTFYGAYVRNYSNRSPNLLCENQYDRYTVSKETGNKWLNYPIGLINVDEVMLAGGVYNLNNPRYYLRNNTNFWTSSPSFFDRDYALARNWFVFSSGLVYLYNNVTFTYSVRPVINLKANVLISSGDGSENSPYELKLS